MKLLQTSLFVLFFSLMINSGFAQGWGVRAGANFSTLSHSDADMQVGTYAGLYKQFGIVPKILFIQPEIQYSKQGFDTDAKNYDLHYIQIPVVAKLYLLKIISLETGPQFGILVNDNSDDLTFNKFDPAWNFGLNISLPLGLSIGGRYVSSFNDLVNNSGSQNRVFQLGAGLKF